MIPFLSQNKIQEKIEEKIKEKPNIKDWTKEELWLIEYNAFCEFCCPNKLLNLIFWLVIIYIFVVISR